MSLLRRIESARPGADGALPTPPVPVPAGGGNSPTAGAGGTSSRMLSQVPVRESFRDTLSLIHI